MTLDPLTHSQEQPSQCTWILSADSAADQVPDAHGMLLFVIVGELNFLQLGLDVRILNFRPLTIRKNLFRLTVPPLRDKPSWRLREPGDSRIEDGDEYELKRQRDSPSHGSWHVREAERDPIAQHKASNVQDQFDNDQLAAPGGFRRLGLPWRCSGSVDAVADPCDDASNDDLSDGVCCNLEEGTNAHDCRPDQDSLLTAEPVADEEGGNGAEETTDVVECSDRALETRVVGDSEGIEEVGRDDDTSEYTLIVSEQGHIGATGHPVAVSSRTFLVLKCMAVR